MTDKNSERKLRGFRMQKKPVLSHQGPSESSIDTSPELRPRRARPTAIPESDSDFENELVSMNMIKFNDEDDMIAKTDSDYEKDCENSDLEARNDEEFDYTKGDADDDIEIEFSAQIKEEQIDDEGLDIGEEGLNPGDDYDDEDTKPLLTVTKSVPVDVESKVQLIKIAKVESVPVVSSTTGTASSSVAKRANEILQNGTYSRSRDKPDAVKEKEKQMKFLLENFPGVDAMVVHSVLSRHGFNAESAATELAKTRGKRMNAGEYERWRQDMERKEKQQVEEKQSKTAKLRANYEATLKRKATFIFETCKKKIKVKRTDVDSDSDDSDDTSTKNYTDNRVYNSDTEDSDVDVIKVEPSNDMTSDKKKVLEFLQSGKPTELQLMVNCSKRKVDAIIESRPFNDWTELVSKLKENKNLSTDILNAAQQVISTRNSVQHLMKKCTTLAQGMEREVDSIALGCGITDQPQLLNPSYKLTSYQMVGLNWLAVLHKQGVNGILADEMGLGKTVQVIAFLAHLKEIGAARKTHLVVVPSSTLDNWNTEFKRWCPALRVFMYFGSTDERRAYRVDWSKGLLKDYDVILTTYTMVGSTPEERKMFRITMMQYVIFDEAHMLKNMNTQRYENLIRINATNRILLTGTPLQNNLLELMSLLIFVMPQMFAGKTEDLKSLFQKNSRVKQSQDEKPTFESEQIEQAKRIMKPFVLRRLKKDVLKDLPPKTDEVLEIPMAPTQQEQYENLVESFKNANLENVNSSYNGVAMMSDLRKLSNHPLLLRYHYQYEMLPEIAGILASDPSYKDKKVEYIIDDLAYMSDFEIHSLTKEYQSISHFALPDNLILTSGKFIYLDQKLEELKNTGHRVLIFSQYVILLNVMEAYLRIKNYTYLRLDGSTPVNLRQTLIDEYTENDNIFIFLLSTKAGGLGINLTSADTVIIHDIDFNPYNDKQAEDRCHRMGQQKPVSVYRLISKDTIEEGMWQLNKEKLKLEQDITTDIDENTEVKSVVKLLSSALGIDQTKATNLVSPPKKKTS